VIWSETNNDKAQNSIELSRLIERHPSELQEFVRAGERIRKLFAELAQKKAA
jgi:hypothetical protein